MKKKLVILSIIFIFVCSVFFGTFAKGGYIVKAYGQEVTTRELPRPYDYGIVYVTPSNNYSYSYQLIYDYGLLDDGYLGGYYKLEIIIDSIYAIDLESGDTDTGTEWGWTRYIENYNNEYMSTSFSTASEYIVTEDFWIDENEKLHYTSFVKKDIQLVGRFRAYVKVITDNNIPIEVSVNRLFFGYYRMNRARYEGYDLGYSKGYDEGDEHGYGVGYQEGTADTQTAQYWFTGLFNGFQGFLNIEIMNGLTIGTLILIPFAITFVWFIIRQFRGGGSS